MKTALIVFACLSVGAFIGIFFMCLVQINKGSDSAALRALETKNQERESDEQIE